MPTEGTKVSDAPCGVIVTKPQPKEQGDDGEAKEPNDQQ